jgi:hypothetical protein
VADVGEAERKIEEQKESERSSERRYEEKDKRS